MNIKFEYLHLIQDNNKIIRAIKYFKQAMFLSITCFVLFLNGACATGPSDFLSRTATHDSGDNKPLIRSMAKQQELVSSLESEKRKSVTAASTDTGMSVGELAALRRLQLDQAERLRFGTPTAP